MSDSSPPGCCAWCGRPLLQRRHTNCSTICRTQWRQHGSGPSAAQIERRMAHADAQPRGAETVEDYIRRGGTVYRER